MLIPCFIRYAFATFDANNDGTIDFDEFLLAIAATSQGDLDDRLEVAFEMYDVSGDGQIDQKELSNMIAAMVKDLFVIENVLLGFFSMIFLVKLIVKVIVIQRNVQQKLLLNLMLVVIRN
jgi:hypothetical protein